MEGREEGENGERRWRKKWREEGMEKGKRLWKEVWRMEERERSENDKERMEGKVKGKAGKGIDIYFSNTDIHSRLSRTLRLFTFHHICYLFIDLLSIYIYSFFFIYFHDKINVFSNSNRK